MAAKISPGFKKLLEEPSFCEIATLMPDGSPHIAEVWVDTDGEHVLINTNQHSQKVRNAQRDPRVAVNVIDPRNQWRLANVRGRVIDITTAGANEEIDRLGKRYRGWDEYPYKDPNNPRVTMKILPEKIREVGLDS
ncbi:MAG TPA: PPOX class F420-dependent oxidoreductase [Thermomicrobiaceae bacterium]|nr:PPOX class F420-dependent oxidoreductase [Thermomicrobiaceae bacterium]